MRMFWYPENKKRKHLANLPLLRAARACAKPPAPTNKESRTNQNRLTRSPAHASPQSSCPQPRQYMTTTWLFTYTKNIIRDPCSMYNVPRRGSRASLRSHTSEKSPNAWHTPHNLKLVKQLRPTKSHTSQTASQLRSAHSSHKVQTEHIREVIDKLSRREDPVLNDHRTKKIVAVERETALDTFLFFVFVFVCCLCRVWFCCCFVFVVCWLFNANHVRLYQLPKNPIMLQIEELATRRRSKTYQYRCWQVYLSLIKYIYSQSCNRLNN